MSRGKKGIITQTTMCVKIENELINKLKQIPSWNTNKNKTINVTLKIGLKFIEQELNKQKRWNYENRTNIRNH